MSIADLLMYYEYTNLEIYGKKWGKDYKNINGWF
jgi:hypothetical protein